MAKRINCSASNCPGCSMTQHGAGGMNDQAQTRDDVGRVSPRGAKAKQAANAGSGDPAYKTHRSSPVSRVPSRGAKSKDSSKAESGDPADNAPLPRRLRRLDRVWPDREGNISYLLTICVKGRIRVLDNEPTFERLVSFLTNSPVRYHWFGRRFVIMPDHIHLIAHMGHESVRLGQWIKALKAVVGGMEYRTSPGAALEDAAGNDSSAVGCVSSHGEPVSHPNAGSGDPAYKTHHLPSVGRVPSHGAKAKDAANTGSGDPGYNDPPAVGHMPSRGDHEFTRTKSAWRWQEGFHDHKFRSPESEARKWEYVCLNPVRAGLVKRPEEWPYAGEIFYGEAGAPRLVRSTPPLLETGMLIEEDEDKTTPWEGASTPIAGNRPPI
ncbi:MAG TPA: hypothetical protein PLT00_02630 [Verrucomicrobiota bacterium]|nr:hypothetical protein [Verrucomicrobiota bacterium]HQB15590.1 hypothetical protein [Verrucomicrobiota bacterium]